MKERITNLQEHKVHGVPMLPFYIYLDMNLKIEEEIYCHWHKDVEFIYVEKGSIDFNIDMKKVRISSGECILINGGSLHFGKVVSKQDSIHHAIVFNLDFLSSAIYDYCQSKYLDPIINGKKMFPLTINNSIEWGTEVTEEIKSIIKCYRQLKPGWEIGIKSSLLKVISILAANEGFKNKSTSNLGTVHNNTNGEAVQDYKIDLIKKIINYIHDNYKNKIYVDSLARVANMNTQYFCRFFKTQTGKTSVDYINQYRIERATKILQNEDRKIMDICYEVGFENFSYFIKKFKEYKNCTPAKFRKLNK